MNQKCQLAEILNRAWAQAMHGKGDIRHGHGRPFEKQDWKRITDDFGLGFPLGQAEKKMFEAYMWARLSHPEKSVEELLGAIVYLAMAIHWMEGDEEKPECS
jgi:hypothetical protein